MTRFYALVTLVALVRLAAPRVERSVERGAVVATRMTGQFGAIVGERWAYGDTLGSIAWDVVGCIATDISEGLSR